MGSPWWDHATPFLRGGPSDRHKDNPPSWEEEGGRREGMGISRSLSPGLWGGSSPVIRSRGRRGRGCNGFTASEEAFEAPKTEVTDWNMNCDSLFLLVCGTLQLLGKFVLWRWYCRVRKRRMMEAAGLTQRVFARSPLALVSSGCSYLKFVLYY